MTLSQIEIDYLVDLVERMAASSIEAHYSPRKTISGKPMKSRECLVDHVLVTLPPHLQLEAAYGRLRFESVGGIPLRISEKPSVINKPSGRWIISTMSHYINAEGRDVGSVGRGVLCPEVS